MVKLSFLPCHSSYINMKGADFNLKLVIRGERGSGKSALLRRLQGQGFSKQYVPTGEIQSGTISWSYKHDEAACVKVEVWDVVDKGFNKFANGDINQLIRNSNGKKLYY